MNIPRAMLAVGTAAIIWGATGSVMKLGLLSVPVFSLAFIRFGSASLILFLLLHKKLSVEKKDLPFLFLMGLIGITFHISLFFWGLTFTTALNTGVITATAPIFTAFFAYLFLKEKIKKRLIAGAILGILGVGIIIGKDIAKNGFYLSPFGDLLILLATLTFIFYELLIKRLFAKYDSFVITFYVFAFGTLGFLPFTIYEFLAKPNWLAQISTTGYIAIVYGILFSSLTAYSLWQWGLSKIPVSQVGVFSYLDPITATITAVLLLSEKITIPFVIGAVFIFIGLFIAEAHLHTHKMHRLKH